LPIHGNELTEKIVVTDSSAFNSIRVHQYGNTNVCAGSHFLEALASFDGALFLAIQTGLMNPHRP
jgi:hypothetical protein